MPILKGAVTFSRFFAEPTKKKAKDQRRGLATALRGAAFTPLDRGGEEDRAAGWVELEDHESTELAPSRFLYDNYLLVTWRVDAVRVPASAVTRELDEWSHAFEEKIGHPPKRSDKASEKELILKRLRKRAFVTTRTSDVSWNLDTNAVQIWASSKKTIEEIQMALEESFAIKLQPTSPGARAEEAGIEASAIRPTEALFGEDVASEVRRDG